MGFLKPPFKDPAVPKNNALPLNECLAKTYLRNDGVKCAGRLVLNHCEIVGFVARELISRMPDWLRTHLFPKGSELIAGAHDIGKVSPTFQKKIYQETHDYIKNPKLELEHIDSTIEKVWGGHAGVSQLTAQTLKFGKFIPEILGQHHGYSPTSMIAGLLSADQQFGGSAWQERREELTTELKQSLSCNWPIVTSDLQAAVLSGLTTVSDWIGSGGFFENPNTEWRSQIKRSLDNAGFVIPKWITGLSFNEIFEFGPHDVQQKLVENCKQSGVYILEAPMGLGKTEAALYAAYSIMTAGKATGFYFALPTQLTSDKIYDRVNNFLMKVLAADCPHKKALLLHGNAWLKETEMGEDGKPGGSWFQSSKRGILTPFAVGTIDQALMAVMNVKHGFIRTFGLAGKVVILDEVHTYDAYTGTILDKLVSALRDLHCTVIILSATLTHVRRKSFLGLEQKLTNDQYPLISVLPKGSKLTEIHVKSIKDAPVTIHHCTQDREAIDEALRRAEEGQQVLWIENTVAEAQERFQILSAKAYGMNIAAGLLHSRFIKSDRNDIEEKWVNLYGKNGRDERQLQGRILVGTQVLEQSLDIDADFLVTRMCPTDMLLQRMGRLWRHEKTVRPGTAHPEAWLLTPLLIEAIDDPEKAFGKTAIIYSPYVLCRSLEVWHSLKNISIPGQIRELLELTYQERLETGNLAVYKADLEKKREALERFALIGLSQGGKTLPEHKAYTRYNEQESVEVLLLKSYCHATDGTGTYITLLNGEKLFLPHNCKKQSRKRWRELSAQLMQNTVRVIEYLAPELVNQNVLGWLRDYLYLGNKEEAESVLRVALVRDNDEVTALNSGAASKSYQLNYNNQIGYHAAKK